MRLRFDQASFSAQVNQAAGATKRAFEGAAGDIGKAMHRGIGAGMGSIKSSLGSMGGHLKSALGFAATLGGAASMASFVRQALSAEEQAGAVAAQLRRMGEDGAKTGDVLRFSVEHARKLGQTTEDVAGAYAALLDETGDPVFSRAALDSVAQFQHAFRLAAPEAAGLVGALRDGLGATTEQLRGDFAPALRDAISQGGINAKELAALAPQIVKTMTTIGSQGGGGFVELVGLLNMTEGALGGVENALRPVGKLLVSLRSENLKKLGGQLGIKFDKGASSAENLSKIMGTKGGVESLEKAFGKDKTGAFRALMLKFEEAQKAAAAEGLKPEQARKAAAEKFSAELARMTRVTSTTANVEADRAARLAEKSVRFSNAVDRMAMAFTKPEILDGMDKLAGALPAVATGFSKLVGFVAENPWTAGGAALGLRVLPPAIFAGLAAILKGAGKGGPGGGVGASSVAVMNVGVLNVGPGGGVPPVVPPVVPSAAPPIAPAVAGAGALLTTVGVIGAAVGGVIAGDMIRSETIDPEQRRQLEVLTHEADSALGFAASASGGGASASRKMAAVEALKRSRKEVMGTGEGVTDTLNTIGAMLGGAKSPERMRNEKLSQIADAESELERQIDRRIKLEARLAAATDETAKAFEGAAKSARGVRRPAAPLPGAEQGG